MAKKGEGTHMRHISRVRKEIFRKKLQFPEISQASPNPILITTVDNTIYYVNPAWERLTGYTLADVQGKNPSFLQSGKTPKRVFKKMEKSLLKGESFATEEIIDRRKDGAEYQIYSVFFPIKRNNRIVFYIQILHDITEHVRLEKILHESEEKLRFIINNANGYAICMLNKHGNITSWNPGAERLFGYSSDEIIGKHFSIFYPQEDIKNKKPWKILRKAAERGRYEEDGLRLRQDRTFFWANVVLSAIRGKRGALKGFVKITRNITSQKELDRQKDAFIGIASHELKTPITVLSGYSQILEKRLKKRGDKQNVYILSKIIKQTDILRHLIDDLLNVSKIHSGKLEVNVERFNLSKLIMKVITDFQYITETPELVREGDIEVSIRGDKNRIEQVLINLLTNAIKYSPKADKVVISLSVSRKYATVAVKDFGVGIAKEDLPHVFERFYRTHAKEQGNVSGFGLGLYISSEIIKKQKGKIWVESEKGKGSIFYFSLPIT